MTTLTVPSKPPFLGRKLALGITPAHILVVGIMLLSAGLHFANLEAIGDANTYYTAAVKSMLQSWSNFFFVAAEPGGSVTVDKPPLGLWVETAFAFVLGVEGWVVSLPNILAGIFSVPLLYHLVKRYMGELAGLVAALVLVVTPVAIATDRNNTMDGMLVFTLLLAAWAFLAATERQVALAVPGRVPARAGIQHQDVASLPAAARFRCPVSLRRESRLVEEDFQHWGFRRHPAGGFARVGRHRGFDSCRPASLHRQQQG